MAGAKIKSNFLNSFLESKLHKINTRDVMSSKFNDSLLDHYYLSSNSRVLLKTLYDKNIGN